MPTPWLDWSFYAETFTGYLVAAILVRMGAKEKKGREFWNRYGQAIRWWGVKQNFL